VGEAALHGAASDLAASEEVRERYLGVARTGPSAPARSVGTPTARRPDLYELRVEQIGVHFGGVVALDQVSFTVSPGTIHALIGPNGAGKSSCLNVLTGVYRATEGWVRLGEVELTRLRPHQIARLRVSRTFQNISLSAAATVADNLMLGRYRLGRWGYVSNGLRLPWAIRERRTHEERVREIATLTGLHDKLQEPVRALSYGDRKRVELARALCSEPTLLLLDEPVAGMNAVEKQEMAATIAETRAALGISILLVEHDMTFVMGLAERVTVLDFGRRIADGTPLEVQHDPEVLRAYLGRQEDSALAREIAAEEAGATE
jgi:ABC-type branched-subunit amino acid transport system ATPase component